MKRTPIDSQHGGGKHRAGRYPSLRPGVQASKQLAGRGEQAFAHQKGKHERHQRMIEQNQNGGLYHIHSSEGHRCIAPSGVPEHLCHISLIHAQQRPSEEKCVETDGSASKDQPRQHQHVQCIQGTDDQQTPHGHEGKREGEGNHFGEDHRGAAQQRPEKQLYARRCLHVQPH